MSFDDSPFGAAFDSGESVETTDATVDHVAAALDRLPLQFEDQPNIIKVVTAFVQPMQKLETAIAAVILQRSVNIATGVTLTMLGTLVGQTVRDIDDEVYRRAVRTRIAANKSDGVHETIIRIAKLVVNEDGTAIYLKRQGRAAFSLQVLNTLVDDVTANTLIDFLIIATAAGVRPILETQQVADDDTQMLALDAFADGAMSPTDTTIIVDSTTGFPGAGSLILDEGLAAEETVTYSGITSTSFIGVSPLANAHPDTSEVKLADGPGLGMGDTADATLGGEMASARDADYTP